MSDSDNGAGNKLTYYMKDDFEGRTHIRSSRQFDPDTFSIRVLVSS